MYQFVIYSRKDIIDEKIEKIILERYGIKVSKYTLENELRENLMETETERQIDILLVDVMDALYELKLVKNILNNNPNIVLIFILHTITCVTDFFNLEPVAVLEPSFKESQLYEAIEKALTKIHVKRQDILQVSYRGKILYIPLEEVFYVESNTRYSIFHMKNGNQKIRMKLSDVLALLPQNFVRCHQSFIINVNKIKSYIYYEVLLENGDKISISRKWEKEARGRINMYFKKNND